MFRNKLAVLIVTLSVVVSVCSAAKILQRIGKWRVEVGPPGNEVYQSPEDRKEEVKPPSQAVLRWAKIIVLGYPLDEWEQDDGEYELTYIKNDKEYKFEVTADGELTELQFESEEPEIEEEADELVLRGTKKSIAISEVPKRTLAALAKAYPNVKPSKAWTAQTIAGNRYVIQVGEMAFYARIDGQIQAARGIHDGGLNEIYPPGRAKDPKLFEADLKEMLGPFRQRFNFVNQIKKLGKGPGGDGSYRYGVMGDSRSQWSLWSSIVKHIESLDPKPVFVINSGDLVPSGYINEFSEYYIPPLLETDIPHFVAIGNHDEGADDQVREYRYLFGENSLNYYFDYGKTRYVFIDNATDISDENETLNWLDKILAETPVGFSKYVVAHKPPETIEKWAYHSWDGKESKKFTRLMSKYKVSEVYMGHIHAYSTAQLDGVKYTLSGGGGAGLHIRFGPKGNVHHYLICDVSPDGTVKQQLGRFYDTTKDGK